MATGQTTLVLTHPNRNLDVDNTSKSRTVNNLINFARGVASGEIEGTVDVSQLNAPVAASGTVTIASGSGSETATINGVAIAVTWATSDANTAALLAAAINASTNALVQGFVTARAAQNIVTITAVRAGVQGNAITLAGSGTGVTASAANLANGADGTSSLVSNETKASGTATFSGASGACSVTINGTAINITAAGGDTTTAQAFAGAINSTAAINGLVQATNAAGVVTITSKLTGKAGNAITLAGSGTGVAVSGARLTGGVDDTNIRLTYA